MEEKQEYVSGGIEKYTIKHKMIKEQVMEGGVGEKK